ncbi:MAG: DNA polymerase III subunit delta, partial [Phycisphaerae bacterium]|nr:DNA polymerase III subunit delta [Phycisphaerae bacterium]
MATKQARQPKHPPLIVIFGDEDFQKQRRLHEALDALLPPEVDRAMALSEYDGTASEEQGGPVYASIADDLATLPFLADRRVVVIREADRFISACREKLERWVAAPPPTGVLILECRGFPKNTRLYKAAVAVGALLHECKKLYGRALSDFAVDAARQHGRQLEYPAAAALVDLVGQDQGQLAGEVAKLCLYVGERQRITRQDVATLVGQSREEKIFAALDAAGAGRPAEAL